MSKQFRNKFSEFDEDEDTPIYDSLYNNPKKDEKICKCEFREMINGHLDDCPEKGKSLPNWLKKKWKY
jgi:hypothetical protein